MRERKPTDSIGAYLVAKRCRVVRVEFIDKATDLFVARDHHLTVNGKPLGLGDIVSPGDVVRVVLASAAGGVVYPPILELEWD